MATSRKRKKTRRKTKKARGRVKVKQSVQLRHKGDTASVDTARKAPAKTVVLDNGANFKITIRKKKH